MASSIAENFDKVHEAEQLLFKRMFEEIATKESDVKLGPGFKKLSKQFWTFFTENRHILNILIKARHQKKQTLFQEL